MATNLEIEKEQMEKLYDLLMIQKADKDAKEERLNDTIARTMSGMKKENIAWVEQMVKQRTK